MNERTIENVIGEILESVGKTVEGLKNCLFSGNKRLMNETKKAFAASLRSSLPAFVEAIQRTGKSSADERPLMLLPACQRLGIAMEDLVGGVQAMVETGICLTDKALAEISEVMALLKDLARDANDAISSGNTHFRRMPSPPPAASASDRQRPGWSTKNGSSPESARPRLLSSYLTVMDALKRVAQELGDLCEKA